MGTSLLENHPIKVKAPPRPKGSVVRRTNFEYIGHNHGTFYKFDKDHFKGLDNVLRGKKGDRFRLVLMNQHTDQLDEVEFELEFCSRVSDEIVVITGFIADIVDCWEIEIRYHLHKPEESYILVFASARPDYKALSGL